MSTILERHIYIPEHYCRECDWFRWIDRRRFCFHKGDIRSALEPGAIADFCDNFSSEYATEADRK